MLFLHELYFNIDGPLFQFYSLPRFEIVAVARSLFKLMNWPNTGHISHCKYGTSVSSTFNLSQTNKHTHVYIYLAHSGALTAACRAQLLSEFLTSCVPEAPGCSAKWLRSCELVNMSAVLFVSPTVNCKDSYLPFAEIKKKTYWPSYDGGSTRLHLLFWE